MYLTTMFQPSYVIDDVCKKLNNLLNKWHDTEKHKDTPTHHNISQKSDMTKRWNFIGFIYDEQNNKHADHTVGNFKKSTFQA